MMDDHDSAVPQRVLFSLFSSLSYLWCTVSLLSLCRTCAAVCVLCEWRKKNVPAEKNISTIAPVS